MTEVSISNKINAVSVIVGFSDISHTEDTEQAHVYTYVISRWWTETLTWQHTNASKMTYELSKLVGRTDLDVLVCDQSLSVGLCTQDHKSLP